MTYGVGCDYSTTMVQRRQPILHAGSRQIAPSPHLLPSSIQFSMSVADLADKIERVLQLDESTDRAFLQVMSSISHRTVEFFHHFITMAAHASSSSDAHRRVMSGKMIQLAFQVQITLQSISFFAHSPCKLLNVFAPRTQASCMPFLALQ